MVVLYKKLPNCCINRYVLLFPSFEQQEQQNTSKQIYCFACHGLTAAAFACASVSADTQTNTNKCFPTFCFVPHIRWVNTWPPANRGRQKERERESDLASNESFGFTPAEHMLNVLEWEDESISVAYCTRCTSSAGACYAVMFRGCGWQGHWKASPCMWLPTDLH